MSLLEVDKLSLDFQTSGGVVQVLKDVSFALHSGESLGIVGESGSGKSVTSLAILQLLANNAQLRSGAIRFHDEDLLKLSQQKMQNIRGRKIAMIFQDPLSSLDPCYTIQNQIAEVLLAHGTNLSPIEIHSRVLQLLNAVGIPHPESRMNSYPHELSGGMCQRVMIAIAIACNPEILIADEPTTALDVTVQAQILALIGNLRKEKNMGLILVSHDLGMISQHTDRILVMYAGEVVEEGPSKDLLLNPKHPYTKALLRSTPSLESRLKPSLDSSLKSSLDFNSDNLKSKHRLSTITGVVPDLRQRPQGCQFSPRCDLVQKICLENDIAIIETQQRKSRCLFN